MTCVPSTPARRTWKSTTPANRFEVEMQLRDRSGKVIGAVGTVFAYKDGDDKAALHARVKK